MLQLRHIASASFRGPSVHSFPPRAGRWQAVARPFAILLLAVLPLLLRQETHVFAARGSMAVMTITSVDTMKESRDTETRPLSDAAIAQDVQLSASLGVAYITVDTHWDYSGYMRRWVQAVRSAGKHVWFRIHPNQWGDNNGTTGIMTPAAYEAAERDFILANASLFRPGDILDPCPEPENGSYWDTTYGQGWTSGAPNAATREYSAFVLDVTSVADSALSQVGDSGVITDIRSVNSFMASHPNVLDQAVVARLGRITVDSYPDAETTDPATATAAWTDELSTIEQARGVPEIIGEMGYSRSMPVDDATQAQVLRSELSAFGDLPYLAGVNYWVGAGTDSSGGFTHVFNGSHGSWTTRPAATVLSAFFARSTGQSSQ